MGRTRTLAVAAALTGATLAGCTHNTPISYAPAAYGANGQCYYDSDPAEAQQLLVAGLCPAGWVPTPMPLAWHEEYWSYYSSPAYYNVYVPAATRTVYISHETTFHTTYVTQINAASKSAVYKGSNGKTVTGTTAKMKFSSGAGSTSSQGGGSLRGGTKSSVPPAKTGTGSTSKTGSSGGSLRSGSTGGRK